ncbi:DNA-directed RNA polymerases II 24 kDa polypeptide (RNA polymerase II subunit 5) [Dimargaris cristalligena]|uniref:DNA-directed RNA polymerases I, II, and III subunit RPABC1 n=1 Tax=Dimargaris cristalligena TaxID=215637 RepID=A0A4P9ZMA2_9FUNG|nr:DNA-directed RNA polymerases II 24 kDa polypeptide (RNA polymerase II subunit 5) [Dimargaris cristalligena]RKP34268.1 RNA polymerase Rpb5, C-terminal domain-containing protein [Dimargaris cristalligena]|eukprot:RKP34268.1 RNA polymerase Rpb5, C-terminal domain-containing protein [Dimargaris cristalligena]
MDSYDSREVPRLWRVNRTIHEMMSDRGYLVGQSELTMPLEQFQQAHAPGGKVDRTTLTFLVQKRDDPSDQIFVFFPDDTSLGVAPIRKYCERMISQNVQKGVVIYVKNLTSAAVKIMDQMRDKYRFEFFKEAELMVNITRHRLVPKHEILTPEEKRTLLHRYRLKETQLPRIQNTDPVARYYGLDRGQVVKITRASETAGRYLTYRLCM